MLGPDTDFPVHLSINKPLSFRVWVACFPLDRNVPEVRSLAYLDHYDEVAANVVAWVLWSITHVYAGRTLPFPDAVTHIDRHWYETDPLFQYPLTMPFPREITYNPDTRFKAQEKWEHLCSWVQYWHEAGMHQDLWLEPCSHHLPYFGSERRWESQLVLFIMFRLNPVLPVEAPIHLDVIMANTGWDLAHAEYKEKNQDLIQKMNRQEREKMVPEEHEREVIHTHERTRGEVDCKYLKTLTCTTIRRHQEAKKQAILVAEKKGSRHQQTSQVRCVESCHRDKHRSSHHRTPPAEKTLTKTMPQGPVPMLLVRLHCNHTTSEWETTSLEPAEGEQGLEVETPPPPTEGRPGQTPMPELRSEDEEDPLSWEKYLASLACKEQAHTGSLQCLVLLPNTLESAPQSQADNIADTPEAESEPAEAHELTGEGTTNATDPTTSDGFTEGNEGDGDIDYDELKGMATLTMMSWRRCTVVPLCARMTGMRVSSCLWLQNTTQCQAHPPPHWTSLGQTPAWCRMHPR